MKNRFQVGKPAALSELSREENWIDAELGGCQFADVRLGQRLHLLLKQMSGNLGESIPVACQDWANTKAAYRFFSNERVSEEEILAGHFASTRERIASAKGHLLILHDTTEFSYQRDKKAEIGLLHRAVVGKCWKGRLRHRTICGLQMHSSLAVTTEGLPLGLAAIKFWTRKEFKGCNALKRKINSDPRANRGKGKLSMAGEPAPSQRAFRSGGALCACRGS